MTLYKWSKTAANNATADSLVNWQEGQAPSSVNDSARQMMAAVAKYRDDVSGAIVTSGTSTAYTVSSFETFDTLANLGGRTIAFTPHVTNGATVTLSVDGLGAKPLRSAPGAELLAGTLIQGTPYTALYNNSDAVWYLQNFYGNPYNVPLGAGMDYWGTTAPNSAFVFPYGQAISRSTYSTLFSLFSTTYGVGDNLTTFNIPDLRGRVTAKKDDMGGSSANRLTNANDGLNGDTLGGAGGGETQALATSNLPAYTPSGSVSSSGSFTKNRAAIGYQSGGSQAWMQVPDGFSDNLGPASNSVAVSSSFTGNAQGGTSTAFGIVQPTIICNYIIRII
ncbi:tail fiber protein [Bradyrhizobium sp. AUGA SZCCT0169]|uniref:tail fiber protein n=1 Tax=Bradyrhizobium sp. AUGA SZCCT0169 TaxID=2807663 RepID=UPI001BA457B2|nr:tail fiber protein [Bradyrhizobium sp. AUGA SZCCT0169]MBR1249407.1 tail fiber protein [Bradyrhizobium sp. AUGA SZCCT0169]